MYPAMTLRVYFRVHILIATLSTTLFHSMSALTTTQLPGLLSCGLSNHTGLICAARLLRRLRGGVLASQILPLVILPPQK